MILSKDKNFITNSEYPNEDWTGNADYVIDDNSELAVKILQYFPNYKIITSVIKEVDENGEEIEKNVVIDVIKEEDISEVKTNKKKELSAECEKTIVAGVDVGDAHYSLMIEDQANILAWMAVAQTGKSVPYHSDGNPCVIYTAEEFLEVANAAVAFKTAQTTYCNLLMRQVETMTDIDEVKAVEYGITQLEGEYAEQYQIIMASLVGDNGETNS